VPAATAAEVASRFAPGDAAKGLLRDGLSPGEYLDLLTAGGHWEDAVRFLANALPKREAVWWACLGVRSIAGQSVPESVVSALRCAEAWVAEPSEENRRAAMPAAEAAGFNTAAGCAALAAFWSGGSLGPPNVPVIAPAEHLTAHGVACSVTLAAVSGPPEKMPNTYRALLAEGVEVATGQRPWPEHAPARPAEPPKPGPTPLRQTVRWE
jgi:hypothetical protein